MIFNILYLHVYAKHCSKGYTYLDSFIYIYLLLQGSQVAREASDKERVKEASRLLPFHVMMGPAVSFFFIPCVLLNMFYF